MNDGGAERFEAFVDALANVIGHADRVRPLRDYCMGLLTPAERKGFEPLAAVTAPSRVSAQPVAASLRGPVPLVRREGAREGPGADAALDPTSEPIEAWIVDDTSFPKKGKHSVG